jgi:hypothetical protein
VFFIRETAMLLTTAEKVTETVLAYYRLAEVLPASAKELASWFDSLLPDMRTEVNLVGLQQAILLPAFKRHLLERRGYPMQAYMAMHLTPHELRYWVNDNDGGVQPA